MKIKDLTLEEKKKICEKSACSWCSLIDECLKDNILEKEVEVNENA